MLGDKETVLYGKGYITDILLGLKFKISSKSFYQINPEQTEKLYSEAIRLANLTKADTLLDAYCGVGTIGTWISKHVKEVNGQKKIKFTIRKNDCSGKIRISVHNTGENISEEDLNRIWNRFYKVDSSRNRANGGSGIGLSLVNDIINSSKNLNIRALNMPLFSYLLS